MREVSTKIMMFEAGESVPDWLLIAEPKTPYPVTIKIVFNYPVFLIRGPQAWIILPQTILTNNPAAGPFNLVVEHLKDENGNPIKPPDPNATLAVQLQSVQDNVSIAGHIDVHLAPPTNRIDLQNWWKNV